MNRVRGVDGDAGVNSRAEGIYWVGTAVEETTEEIPHCDAAPDEVGP